MTDPNDFFKPGGVWRAEYGNDPEQLRRCLEDPFNSLRPWWDDDARKKLIGQGLELSELQRSARSGLDRILSGLAQGGIGRYEEAIVRLLLESLIDRGDLFPGLAPQVQRNWLRGLDARPGGTPNMAPFHGVSPHEMLKLACKARALGAERNELRQLIKTIVPAALAQAQGDRPIGIESMARLAALRSWVRARDLPGTSEHENDVGRQIEAAIGDGSMQAVYEEVSGAARAYGRLTAELTAEALGRLLSIPSFRESASFYGFQLDEDSIRRSKKIRERWADEKDPWIKMLLSIAMATDDRSEVAAPLVDGLPEGLSARAVAFDAFEARRIALSSGECATIIKDDGVVRSGAWHERVFATFLEAEMDGRSEEVRRSADAAGLVDWYGRSKAGYRREATALEAPTSAEIARLAQTADGWSRLAPLDRHAGDILSDAHRRSSELLRDEVRQAGRIWLYDFIHACAGRDPAGFDAGRGILTEEDRQQVLEFLSAKGDGVQRRRWWDAPMDASRELRLREAAARLLRREDADLDRLARQISAEIESRCREAVPAEILGPSLEECLEIVIGGRSGGRPKLLASFRAADAEEFRATLDPAQVELPPRRRRKRVFGRRVALLLATLLAVPTLLLWRVWTASAAPARVADPSPAPMDAGSPLVPKDAGWRPNGGGQRWLHAATGAEVRSSFGDGVLVGTRSSARETLVSFDVARAFVERYRRWLESQHPAGIRVAPGEVLPWSRVAVRLARESELSQDGGGATRRVWIENGELVPPVRSGDRREGEIDVVIERRD